MSKNLRFPNLNQIVITGRLTREAELKYTNGNVPVIQLPIAFERVYKDANGEFQKESSFIDVVVWKNQAEKCAEYLVKGSAVLVQGYLQTRSYEAKDGQKRKITEIVASKVQFLEWENDPGMAATANEDKVPAPKQTGVTDDDVPF